MANPRENCPIMNELPSFASATIAPHWQAAYTTFPVRIHAKLDRRDKPGVAGSAPVTSAVCGTGSGATTGKSSRSISLVLTPDPDDTGDTRTIRCASDPKN